MKPPSVQKSIDACPENVAVRVASWVFVAAVIAVFGSICFRTIN